jgi:hypothetical protein
MRCKETREAQSRHEAVADEAIYETDAQDQALRRIGPAQAAIRATEAEPRTL